VRSEVRDCLILRARLKSKSRNRNQTRPRTKVSKLKTSRIVLLLNLLLLAIIVFDSLQQRTRANKPNDKQRSANPATKPDVAGLIANLPLSFEPNLGQVDQRVKYAARASAYDVFLTSNGAVLEFKSNSQPRAAITLQLKDANLRALTEGSGERTERRNYFIGRNQKHWHTDIPTFRAVNYRQIYPGIDLTWYGNGQQLEYDFVVSPGADPRKIKLIFDSEVRPTISASGDLVLRRGSVALRQLKPVLYQEKEGKRIEVSGSYVIKNKREVGFEIGSYDPSLPLTIDPTLVYSTYLGGSGDDVGASIAVDSSNNIYLTGITDSLNFPTKNPAFPARAGLADIFVTKIDAAGANIIYSTYVGGSGMDRGNAIAIDSSGNAYVAGRIDALSIDFPSTPGAYSTSYRGGDFDAVVFKLNGQGNSLVYSTYLGGEENDSSEGITVDAQGNAYVIGGTKSFAYPTTLGAYQGSRAGDTDAVLTKFNAAGSGLLFSTFLGGGGTDRGSGVVVDSTGKAYIAGFTASADFPTENAFQNSPGGSFDAFVAIFDTTTSGASSLLLCSYLGGLGDDKAYGIASDSGANNFFVVGQTSSNNFPVLNPIQAVTGGGFDAFAAKISSAGTKVYATYIGGSADDRGSGIAVNAAGEAYVTGFTVSSNFPTLNPVQGTRGGGSDAFLTKINAAGNAYVYSTFLGGSGNETASSTVTSTNPIALDSLSNAYLTGYTASINFPTALPLQAANAGGASDAFVAKISDTSPAANFTIGVTPSSRTVNAGAGTTYDVTITPTGGFTGSVALSVTGLSADAGGTFNPASITITDASAKTSVLTITTTAGTPPGTYPLTINSVSGNIQHSTPVTLTVNGTASANLSVTKTGSPNPAIALTSLTYRIVVTNNGPSPATNVTATDTLPAGVNFSSVSTTQGSCTGTTTITCNFGSLASGSSAIANIIVAPQAAGQLSNTATTTATESDPNTADNSSTIMTTVTNPSSGPSMTDSTLSVHTVVTGLSQPTSMAFIGPNDFFVLEKDTGKVKRVLNGAVQSTVLDLAVNSASERGLLGLALDPYFRLNRLVYLFWTESSTGNDSTVLADVPLLGNRVDRYVWNGTLLTFDRNLIKLRAYQADANQPLRGNHNGGIIRFGSDGKLYILMGDNGRRGFLQNVTSGAPVPDDQYGGPEPDDAHLTGFVLRLNPDGSTPIDNPFYNASTSLTGEAAANIKKLFAYGVRNGFGMGFDPLSGNLWDQENGDDAFDEMNRITAGSNNGWIQMMGPSSRVSQYKQIESTYGAGNLQQLRWPPSLIADTAGDALSRLYMLPGAHYNEPEFSWKYAVAPSTLGFVQGRGLGPQFEGNMFVGASRTFLSGGFLFRFKLTADRRHFMFDDSRLNDLVADNVDKFDITESETLLIGKDFGITTGIETAPNGNLFVVSNTNGAVYEISGTQPTLFVANLTGAQEVPPTGSSATGTATVLLSPDEQSARVQLNFSGLSSAQTTAHIHGPAMPGVTAPVLFPLPNGNFSDLFIALTPADVTNLKNGLLYINVHSSNFPNGEIRGQFQTSSPASSFQFNTASQFVAENAGSTTLTITRLGNVSQAASIEVTTGGGTASAKTDYTPVSKVLQFAAGETLKTVTLPIVDNAFVQGTRTVNVSLANPGSGAFLGSPSMQTVTIVDNDTVAPTTNPLDDAQFFVNQHYLDFLGRVPDVGGFAYWTGKINSCGSDTACVNSERIGVSAAFFIEQEFQQTGSFVYRIYRAALGRDPSYAEFVKDRGRLIGGPDLQANKDAFLFDFVQRPEFVAKYTGVPFISTLIATAHDASGVDSVELEASGVRPAYDNCRLLVPPGFPLCEARAVETIANYPAFANAVYNRAFVLMQYFGYLRRNPDAAGYAFWLDVITNRDPNNYRSMVCAFITSAEYQQRFSSVVTHSNTECAGVH
jgi:aldose sugar dehydrogenase